MRPSAFALLVVLAVAGGDAVWAQSEQEGALRRDVEQRFDVLPLHNGVVLRPKAADARVRSIEIADGAIAVDGSLTTGAELREKLGADADLVLRLSYLDRTAGRRLFGAVPAETPAVPSASQAQTPVAPSSAAAPGGPGRRAANGGGRVRFGGNIVVEESEVVSGDVVAIGGSVRVDGEVTGNAVAIGGSLTLGPHAQVQGDTVNIGGEFRRDPAARIGGNVVDLGGASGFNFGRGRPRFPLRRFLALTPFSVVTPFFGATERLISLGSTVLRLIVLCVLTSLVLLVGGRAVERTAARASEEPVKAGAIGLLAELLFVPLLITTIVFFVVTIIGIPLLVLIPFALLALAMVALVGFTSVVCNIGRFVTRRFDWAVRSPYMTAITGVVVLLSPVLVARLLGLAGGVLFPITGTLMLVGFVAEYVAWTVGFGAVALLRFAGPGAAPAAAAPATRAA